MNNNMNNNNTQKVDYLRVDEPIPGQNFCCLSFVEPKNADLLENREMYFASHFIKNFVENYKVAYDFVKENGESKLVEEAKKNMDTTVSNLLEKYQNFKNDNLSKMQLEWENLKPENQETTIRGMKVRGCYPTLQIAQMKAKELQSKEPAFDVFVGQTGYWMPFNPQNINEIEAEYDEEQLNKLVKSKIDENEKRKLDFQERTREMTKLMEEENKVRKPEVTEMEDDLLEILDSEDETTPEPKQKTQTPKKPKRNGNKRRRRRKRN
jgi:hypothetical protein